MNPGLTRAQLFAAGSRAGVTMIVAGTGLGALASSAGAAPPAGSISPLSTNDLAYARMLVGTELLLVDFYTEAIASKHLAAAALADARLALINENEHYTYLAAVMTNLGVSSLTAPDISFSYPTGAFYTARSVTALAVTLEQLALGAYLGAAGSVAAPVLAQAIAQIAANEAQHLSAFSRHAHRAGFHDAFPAPLTIAEASDALDAYTS